MRDVQWINGATETATRDLTHGHAFDPTYGYSAAAMQTLQAPPEPDDWLDFWRATCDETLATPVRLSRTPHARSNDLYDAFTMQLDSLDGVRIGGWLVVPKYAPAQRGVVCGHGYGGRNAFDIPKGEEAVPTARIFPVCRGLPTASLMPGVPGEGHGHVLVGIASRETYIHRGCVADLWAAATALLEAVPGVEGYLDYDGGSFGGGIGAMALAVDPRFRRAHLRVPSFGNHPLRLKLPCVGSGAAVRRHHEANPEVTEVLSYFDAAIAARHIQAPTCVSCALFDPAVPPPGQVSVYNALTCERQLLFILAGHHAYRGLPAQERALNDAVTAWFAEA